MWIPALLLTALGAFLASALLSWVAMRVGIRLGIADVPGGRRKHARVTSRLGALPLFGAFTAAALLGHMFGLPTQDPNERLRLLGLLAGGAIAFVLGVIDDRFELRFGPQLFGQALAAGVAITALIFIERFRNPFTNAEIVLPFVVTAVLTLFWFLGMMNTINFLDGVDGLAASVSLVAALFTLIHMLREGQLSVALLPAALAGALLGFLLFNFQPARLFLGGGSLFLGFALAGIGIIAGAKIALLLLVVGLPIADVAWQIFDRARRGRSPAHADRGHLHLRLIDMGWSPRRICIAYLLVCTLFGGAALLSQPPLFKLLTLGTLFVSVVALLIGLSGRKSGA
ncbi:MAG: MraY family glycosyltransferase [Chloroflexi bacterium]|nr:MraY family glycosyltransferase [Chloroflexota bacterium]